MTEHDLGGGWTVVIEWSPKWGSYAGTILSPKGHSSGTILRDTEQACLEGAQQTVNRKG